MHLSTCALSHCSAYATPLGNLHLDTETIHKLRETGKFSTMSTSTDTDEHSLEMHLPYIYKVLSTKFSKLEEFPPLVPILVGSTSPAKEKEYGTLLAPYLADPNSIFVVSSDFCHWGTRFSYTYYLPSLSASASDGHHLRSRDKAPVNPLIHESIDRVDRMAMDAVESGAHDTFLDNLRETGNTVCGRHPIGVLLATLEVLRAEGNLSEGKGMFKFVRYERSSDCIKVSDSSVSYASAFAVL